MMEIYQCISQMKIFNISIQNTCYNKNIFTLIHQTFKKYNFTLRYIPKLSKLFVWKVMQITKFVKNILKISYNSTSDSQILTYQCR